MSLTITTDAQKHPPSSADLADPLSANLVIRQDPFAITLDAPALLGVSILLVTAIHSISRLTLSCLILLIPLTLLVQNDYQNFRTSLSHSIPFPETADPLQSNSAPVALRPRRSDTPA